MDIISRTKNVQLHPLHTFKNDGFTLLELLITITILSILVGIGLPTFSHTLKAMQTTHEIHKLRRLFQMGRHSAINLSKPVILCGTNQSLQCSTLWENRAILFIDKNHDRQASQDEIIHQFQFKKRDRIFKTRMSFGKNQITFTPRGYTSLTGSILLCTQNTQYNHRVTWNILGRPYLGRDKNKDGQIEDTQKLFIQCD